VHVIEIVFIFSDTCTIKFYKTDGCLYHLAVLVGASCVPSYWSGTTSNNLRRRTGYTPKHKLLLKITFPMKLRQAVSALVTVLCGNGW